MRWCQNWASSGLVAGYCGCSGCGGVDSEVLMVVVAFASKEATTGPYASRAL